MTDQTTMNADWRSENAMCLALGERFREQGHELALVGGAVRDALLGETHYDLDFATSAMPEQTEALLRKAGGEHVAMQGEAYGTVGAVLAWNEGFLMRAQQDAWDDDKAVARVEVTTYRSEVYRTEDRKPHVEFGLSLEEDLRRRDFTINAMAIMLPEAILVDPTGGVRDLHHRLLDTPMQPERTFRDDPLRMLRAARFVAKFGAVPSVRVMQAISANLDRLAIVSNERKRDELDKLLLTPKPSLGLRFLVETHLGDTWLPELPALHMPNYRNRHKDVLQHTLTVVDQTPSERIVRLAALFHDVAKPMTREFEDGGVTFHGHEVVGAEMTRHRMKALRYSSATVADVAKLVELHLRPHGSWMWSESAVRRYVREAGHLLDRLNQLARADVTTSKVNRRVRLMAYQDLLEKRIEDLRRQEELDAMRPALDGHEIMQHLGIEPGPAVGEALEYLLEERLERGPMDKPEAEELLDAWWAQHGA